MLIDKFSNFGVSPRDGDDCGMLKFWRLDVHQECDVDCEHIK